MLNEMLKKFDLINLQNHRANWDHDFLTICGFFDKEKEFKNHAEHLQKRIDEFQS